ncbi:MAG: carboxylesterase, partial [Gammaproteobacteria bacterium]|nr:carboxylesterase [Gammaproteobacteria bacterium]
SQGGAIVLQAGLRQMHKLAGIMALSTYLTLPESLASEKSGVNQDTPIFIAHGSIDQVIPVDLAYSTRGRLEKAGYQIEWREYEHMPHSVSLDEINHINDWLTRVLG